MASLAAAPPPLPAGLRRVRHARLRPARADDAAQLRQALEDALNTASFQDCGRLLLVRHLRLRGLPRRAPAALLAQALEQAWREAMAQALPAEHPRAEAAPAVYFASRFEARLRWLQQVALQGAVPAAWFWPLALPELASESGGESAVDAVLLACLADSEPAGLQALLCWPDGCLLALARRLGAAGGQALLMALRRPEALPYSWSGSTAQGCNGPSGQQARSELLALRALIDDVGSAVSERLPVRGERGLTGAQRQDLVSALTLPGDAKASRVPAPDETGSGLAELSMASPARPAPASGVPKVPGLGRPLPWLVDARPTRLGGLLLLLNLLQALGFEPWLARQAHSAGLVDALLHQLLQRYGAADDDPQLAWFEPAGQIQHAQALRRWTLRQRRALRRHARMDLAELLQRPAWVSASPTHLDVLFPLEAVDLRLRRLGLDRDPGWLPWFGRIVAFHYLPRELLPSLEPGPDG
jgi:hypothetical protein